MGRSTEMGSITQQKFRYSAISRQISRATRGFDGLICHRPPEIDCSTRSAVWQEGCSGTPGRTTGPQKARLNGAYALVPDFIDGVLPDGVHTCTLEEVADRFGSSQG